MKNRSISRNVKVRLSREGKVCSIYLDNIGLTPDNMLKCVQIVKRFATEKIAFFGFYRLDGINLTNEEWKKYDEEIPAFFQANGAYEMLMERKEQNGKIKEYTGYLTVGKLPLREKTYDLMPWVFHYFLETICFCPKIDWDTFVQSYRGYMEHGTKGYIKDDFTDFLFEYGDSGDFAISFNADSYEEEEVFREVMKILYK